MIGEPHLHSEAYPFVQLNSLGVARACEDEMTTALDLDLGKERSCRGPFAALLHMQANNPRLCLEFACLCLHSFSSHKIHY